MGMKVSQVAFFALLLNIIIFACLGCGSFITVSWCGVLLEEKQVAGSED